VRGDATSIPLTSADGPITRIWSLPEEYLDSGLIDEFSITLAPVLFGTGIRLFDRVDPARLALDQTRTDASSRVTHLTYTVGKR